jgi:lysozyme family protein
VSGFLAAFQRTMGHEGTYSNDPDDPGGETYRGISRRHHPAWLGWTVVDVIRESGEAMRSNAALQELVQHFYRVTFWAPMQAHLLPEPIALEMFDTAVNMGVRRAVGFLQASLNALNRNATLYPDLTVDGQMGPKTVAAVGALNDDDLSVCLKMMNVFQGYHYLNRMKDSPTQEKYARGWFSRVTIEKT